MPEWMNDPGAPGTVLESVTRLGLAAIAGAGIGLERERPRRHVGLRTNMLVALAACLFTLLAFEIALSAGDDEAGIMADPVRAIEAVTAGVAFIAAGAIIRAGRNTHGVTTAAALWLAGAVGVAFGAGAFVLGGSAVILALIVLAAFKLIERDLLGSKPSHRDGGDRGSD